MTVERLQLRSRRALLGAAFGAAAASVAGALGRPGPARAADPNDVVLGGFNNAASLTTINNDTGAAFQATSGQGIAVNGYSSGSGTGVNGFSPDGVGVYGTSYAASGVFGYTPGGAGRRGVSGVAYGDGTGVSGTSSTAPGSATAPPKTGVFGYAAQDSGARGVVGQTTVGQGVRGLATSGIGVRGYASTTGVAASFEAAQGYAIQSSGRLSFGKASGVATIISGTNNVLVTPGTDVAAGTFVLATLQGSPGGGTTVSRVITDPTNNRFRIYLTANATASVKVAWLAMG